MTEDEHFIAAGEYVLGTLPSAERAAFGARLLTDRPAAQAVRYWEQAFAPLGASLGEDVPPDAVWSGIVARIGPRPVANDRASAWRAAALGLGALAASLGAFMVLRPPPIPVIVNRPVVVTRRVVVSRPVIVQRPIVVERPVIISRPRTVTRPIIVERPIIQAAAAGYLAALSPSGTETALLLTLDAKTGEVEAHPVKLTAPNKRVLELWWIASGSTPRAVGLLDPARPLRVKLDQPGTLEGGTFAVSVEHEGGSVTGAPGEVVYSGKLVRLAD